MTAIVLLTLSGLIVIVLTDGRTAEPWMRAVLIPIGLIAVLGGAINLRSRWRITDDDDRPPHPDP